MDSARGDANAAGWTVGELAQATGLSQRVLRHWPGTPRTVITSTSPRSMMPNC
jgi:hypothetical protein